MRGKRLWLVLLRITLALFVVGAGSEYSLHAAQKPDDAVLERAGFLSCQSEGFDEDIVSLRVPGRGDSYLIRAKFYKAELPQGRQAIAAYFKDLFEGKHSAIERDASHAMGFAAWFEISDRAGSLKSEAKLELMREDGTKVGQLPKLEANPHGFGFKAFAWAYKVKLRCESGAGLYVLRVERDRSGVSDSSITETLETLNDALELAHWTPSCFERVKVGISGLISKDLQVLVTRKCGKKADYAIKTDKAIGFSYVKYEAAFDELDSSSVSTVPGKISIRCKGGSKCVTAEAGFRGEDGELHSVKLPASKEDSADLTFAFDHGASGPTRPDGTSNEVRSWRAEVIVDLIAWLIKEHH